jgi:hypothetical protein
MADIIGASTPRWPQVDNTGDAFLRHLERQRLREAMHAGLRGRIVGLAEAAFGADDRGYIDNAAPAALDHAVAYGLGHIEDRIEVGADDCIPVDLVQLPEDGVAGDAGIVDQNVNRAHFIEDSSGTRCTRFVVGHIDGIGVEQAVLSFHARKPLVNACVCRRVRDNGRVTGIVQSDADGFANPAGPTCDKGDLIRHFRYLIVDS